MMTNFQFATPWALILLPIILALFIFDLKKEALIKLPLSSHLLVKHAKKSWRTHLRFLPALLKMLGLIFLVVALARPQTFNEFTEVTSEGVDIILTLDASGSMRALDMELEGLQTDRLAVVKSVVKKFVTGRQFDRMGMVVFGSQAYTQCPLTFDHEVLLGYLDLIDVGIAGDATALGDALGVSVKRLLDSESKSKIIIFLTDGESNAGDVSPKVAAELAQKNNIKVYTIGVGSEKKVVPIPVKDRFGIERVVYQELRVDEKALTEIAEITGGKYFKADSLESLQEIYKTIDELEKTEIKTDQFTIYNEMYWRYLLYALIFILLAWGVKNFLFFRVP